MDFEDFDTIIYGHNMSTGTMFKTLHNYEDDSFWESNRNVYIYLPDRVMRYEVFAAYRTNDRHILTYNDFSDKEVRKEYLLNIKSERFDEGIVKNDQKYRYRQQTFDTFNMLWNGWKKMAGSSCQD